MDFIKLTNDKLSLDEINNMVAAPNCGAISLFVGTTRDNFGDEKVLRLEYEAYEPMAVRKLKTICAEIREKWQDIQNIAIFHRLGTVPVTETSIVIAISSPHRNSSLEATHYCIDTVKKIAPIWKKEIYEDNEAEWKENLECSWGTFVDENNKDDSIPKRDFDFEPVPSHLIQINCSNEEIKRRIETFMQRKREQANSMNITDFCDVKNDGNSCARVDAVFKGRQNSKSHLKTHRVHNTYGPYYAEKKELYISKAVEERIDNLEKTLTVDKPVDPNIYERLKKIEDRVLLLESISPEYAHFWHKDFIGFDDKEPEEKKAKQMIAKKDKFAISDVDNILHDLEREVQMKKISTCDNNFSSK